MLSDVIFKAIQKISFIKRTKFYRFCKDIIFPFIVTNISKFYKDDIDEKLIVMGAFSGGAFVDNTKYLYEFLNEKSDYKLIWIAKLDHVAEAILKKGYKVISTYSFKAIKLLRTAKFIFMTHGHMDLLPIRFSPKTTKILTFHGSPIKRVDINIKNDFVYNGWGDYFRLKLKNNQYIDYILTHSGNKKEHDILSKQLLISSKKILPLGYPRHDILLCKEKEFIEELRKKYKIPERIKQILLYAPTFRSNRIVKFPISNQEVERLSKLLNDLNSIFLIKGHMVSEKTDFNTFKSIKLMDKSADIQELLLISDLLITDYSSVQIDYLLTLKPIILFPYDFDEYYKTKGLNYDLKKIAGGPIVYTVEDLIDTIRNIDKIDPKFKEKRIMLRERFNKYIDDKSTERILDYFNIKYRTEI